LRLSNVQCCPDHCTASLGQHTLWLPPLGSGSTLPQFAECDPGALLLTRAKDHHSSARNHLPGVVRKIVKLDQGTFVAVDVGQIFWALITPAAAEELSLAVDSTVICILKTHSIRLLQ